MDDFKAIGLAEGFISPSGETDEEVKKEILAAWQHLIDEGICWRLQGWFGRMAMYFIEEGLCRPAMPKPFFEEDSEKEDEPK